MSAKTKAKKETSAKKTTKKKTAPKSKPLESVIENITEEPIIDIVKKERTLDDVKAEIKAKTGTEPDDETAQMVLDAETGDDDAPFPGEDLDASVKTEPDSKLESGAEDLLNGAESKVLTPEEQMEQEIEAMNPENQCFDDLPYGDGSQDAGIHIDPFDLMKMNNNQMEAQMNNKELQILTLRKEMQKLQKTVVEQQLEVLKRDETILEFMMKDLAKEKGEITTKSRDFVQAVKEKYGITKDEWGFDPSTGEVKF